MAEKYQNKLFSAEKKIIEKSGGPLQPSGQSAIHTEEVLSAIAEVKKLIEQSSSAPQSVADMPEMSVLRGQLHDLKESIDKTKSEIAAIHRPGETEDKFVSAALELSAIVSATEEATNNILGAAEDIEDLAQQLRDRLDDVKALENVNKISELVIGIFENCNFQDITGQRTSKVVKTINYLEDRILTMINIWGEEEFKGIELPEDARSEDEKLLEGPQLEGAGISQNDIDSLFD
ncbi:MAG: protein phosphatase CheZ [Rhodospirillaceae bacterium]|nr:protein phosphatase CheZ [Rhodospirillaceae bacterium]